MVEKKSEVEQPQPQQQQQQQQQMNEEEAKFESELKLLEDMGFVDRQKNIVLLAVMNGDLPNVIQQLF